MILISQMTSLFFSSSAILTNELFFRPGSLLLNSSTHFSGNQGKTRRQATRFQSNSIALETLKPLAGWDYACPCELIRFYSTTDDKDDEDRSRLEPVVHEKGCVDCLCKKLKRKGWRHDLVQVPPQAPPPLVPVVASMGWRHRRQKRK